MGAVLAQKRQDPRFHGALEAWTSSWDDLSDLEFAETIQKFLPVYLYDPSFAAASPLATLTEAPLWNYQMLHGKYRRAKCQEEHLRQVKARTMMIFSREDPICTPTRGEATKQGIKDSKLVVLEKCGHFPWMKRKEETLNEMMQFFEEK
jgi:pimeloyl-ACP methyl ester carboxylesterase